MKAKLCFPSEGRDETLLSGARGISPLPGERSEPASTGGLLTTPPN